MVIKATLMSALETALNKFIALNQNSGAFLAPLTGKIIAVTITPFDETLYFCPSFDSIQLLDYTPDQSDTQLKGSIFALGLMGLNLKPAHSMFSGRVKIEGDLNTGRKFQELFSKLDINLEQQLARYTGDNIARNISQFFRAGQSWSKESIETFRLNTSEFLQDETRDLPSAPEIDLFYRQIDELRSDFDRLQNRIERLENTRLKKQ